MKADVNVYVIDFPNSQKEMVIPQEDGNYTIYINAKQSAEQQSRSYKHALSHIENNDFEKPDVQQIEAAAHGIVTENIQPARPAWIEKRIKRLKKERARIQEELSHYEESMVEFHYLDYM